MIKNVKLKFGSSRDASCVTLDAKRITVFIGPNNSGKSKALLEIRQYCTTGTKDAGDVIIDEIELDGFTKGEAEQRISNVSLDPRDDERLPPDHVLIGKGKIRLAIESDCLVKSMISPNSMAQIFCSYYLSYNTLILDGSNRINLVESEDSGDLQEPGQNSLQVLFRDDEKRQKIRDIVRNAFGSYFVVDPTNPGKLRARLSDQPPKSNEVERGLSKESVRFHKNAMEITKASDGVKAFTGIMMNIIAGDPSVMLIDEPEAFLHPALSFQLGKEMASAGSDSGKCLFVSTHSSDFVMGCIQSGKPINIVRLTYDSEIATARLLASDNLLKIMRTPLLRSTGVLSGLFYQFVVVTESDTDRAFYQEINERLLLFKEDWGIPHCLFLNAQNKQTVHSILKPMREMGIPAAAIVDVDILKDGGKSWRNFTDGGCVPRTSQSSLSTHRSDIVRKLGESGKDFKREGGIQVLDEENLNSATDLLEKLSEYGLFVVDRGELESWLKNLNASGHGAQWLINVFEKMGEDPDSNSYTKPAEDDVWEFISKVRQWLMRPNRKGIPT